MNTYSIFNKNQLKVVTSPLGARLITIFTPDRNGNFADIIQGFETEQEYIEKGKSQGAICGRYANRIANGRFALNGEQYQLPQNNGNHCLHGGNEALRAVSWSVKEQQNNSITYQYFSPHLEAGFPGNVSFLIKYHLSEEDILTIDLQAQTDRETVVNLTAHPYFNLKGEGNGTALEHRLQIKSDQLLAVDDELIPTGEFISVEDTDFDFRELQEIGQRVFSDHPLIQQVSGFDHCYKIYDFEQGKLALNAVLIELLSGRVLKVFSDYPGIQFYTANDLNVIGKQGKAYQPYSAICLEPQYFPNSPNQANFPSTIISPSNPYQHTIQYQFEQIQYG